MIGDDLQLTKRAGKLRMILFFAFGGLLSLMVVAGLSALHSLRQMDAIERQECAEFSSIPK
ncbi:MAG: hypothetical protein WBQ89_14160 [Candidatus Acidiferrum sp.]